MKLDRIMGVILSILIFSFIALKYVNGGNIDNPFELIGDNGYISENTVNYKEQVFKSNDESSEIIEFTNPYNYPVSISTNDITITCTGVGETKEEDELLAEKNYNLSTKFSEEKNGNLYNSLMVPKKAKVYIHVKSEYKGQMPNNPVSCEYQVNVAAN